MDYGSYISFCEFVFIACTLITLIGAKLFFSFVSNNEIVKMRIQNFEQSVLAVIMYLIISIGMLISFLAIVPFFLLIIIIGLSISVFIPKIIKRKGRIIRIKRKEVLIYPDSYLAMESDPLNINFRSVLLYGLNIPPRVEIEHLIFLQEEESNEKYFVEVPTDIFDEVERRRSNGLKSSIILFFRKYIFIKIFDHFELD